MKRFIIILFTVFFGSFSFAQSADFVTEILDAEKATYGQAGYLIAVYENFVSDTATEGEALEELFKHGWLLEDKDVSKVIRYDEAAALFSKIWKINGSLMYRITKASPRYSFKQLKADGVISKNKYPSDIPSGADMLNLFTNGNLKYGE